MVLCEEVIFFLRPERWEGDGPLKIMKEGKPAIKGPWRASVSRAK